jgi:hypothetical protein
VHKGCFPGNNVFAHNTVEVNLRHNTRSFFAHFFGEGLTPDVGARAVACTGSIVGAGSAAPDTGFGMIDLLPIAVDSVEGNCFDDDRAPRYGDTCPIQYGSDPCTNRSASTCMPHRSTDEDFRTVDLLDSDKNCSAYAGGGDFQEDGFLEAQIRDGVDAYCLLDENNGCNDGSGDPDADGPWRDCVTVRAVDPHNESDGDTDTRCNVAYQRNDWCDVMAGMTARIAGEDDCGLTGTEAIQPVAEASNLFEAVECPGEPGSVSPRLFTVLVLDQLPSDCAQNHYVGGPGDDDEDDGDGDDCSGSSRGGRQGDDNDGFDVRALATVFVESCWFEDTDPADGVPRPGAWHDDCRHVKGADLVRMRVRFVRLLTQGEIGPPSESATNVGIALGE